MPLLPWHLRERCFVAFERVEPFSNTPFDRILQLLFCRNSSNLPLRT